MGSANIPTPKKEMSKEDADRLLFWLNKIEQCFDDLELEMKVYRRDLQQELDKVDLKNTLQKIVNFKNN